jgi:phage terminase large subunit GpA-like protein
MSRGYHLPSTISTLGDVTLSRLVQKWLGARANGPAALMAFVTTTLAEPWEDSGARVEPSSLVSRRELYDDDVDVPAGSVCLTAGVDVQIDRYEVSVYGWGRGLESWLVDHHVVPGDPTHPEVQSALMSTLDERYRHADGVTMPVIAVAVDAGYLPDQVAYRLAERRPRRVFAVKGVGGKFGEPSILKFDPKKPPALLNVDALKLEVHLGLEMGAPGPGYMHLSRRVADEEFLAQLTAEHRETRRRRGVASLVWVEDRARNEALDCAAYARAALRLLARITGARTEHRMLEKFAERKKPE